jgi:hypothetical protein
MVLQVGGCSVGLVTHQHKILITHNFLRNNQTDSNPRRITQQILQYKPTTETLEDLEDAGNMNSETEEAMVAYPDDDDYDNDDDKKGLP